MPEEKISEHETHDYRVQLSDIRDPQTFKVKFDDTNGGHPYTSVKSHIDEETDLA